MKVKVALNHIWLFVTPWTIQFSSVQSLSCVQLFATPWTTRSTLGLPVHHQLPKSTQTHVHWVGDAIQTSHPLSSPSPPALNLSQHRGLFSSLSLFQGISPIHGSNWGFPHCRQILYQLSHKGSPRILEWVAYPFSRGSSWPRNQTGVSVTGRFFTNWAIREALELL